MFDVIGSNGTSVLVRALAVSAASGAVCLALSAAPAGAQAGSCAQTPTLSFSSSSPLRVPVGGGSAKSPSLNVRCDGAPLAEPDVSLELVPDSVGVTFGQIVRARAHPCRQRRGGRHPTAGHERSEEGELQARGNRGRGHGESAWRGCRHADRPASTAQSKVLARDRPKWGAEMHRRSRTRRSVSISPSRC